MTHWFALGLLAAASLALADYVLLKFLGDQPTVNGLGYAYGLNICWGLFATLALVLGTTAWQRRLGRVLVLVALFVMAWLFNAPLFEGDWIKSQSWMPAARIITIVVLGLLVFVALRIVDQLSTKLWSRWLVLAPTALGLYCLLGLANIGWGPFAKISGPAYVTFKLEITVLAWAAAVIAAGAIIPRGGRGKVLFGSLAALLVVTGTGTAYLARGNDAIHRTRAELKNSPFAASSRFMDLTERLLLNRLKPLPEIRFTLDGVELQGLDQVDSDRVQAELDDLVSGRRDMNVIWIAIDSLRADHLGCYGYQRQTTPNIDALARKSVRFERATTPSPASNMAYSSTLSGVAARISPACYKYYKLKLPMPAGFSIPDVLRQSGRFAIGITAFWKAVQDRPDFATMATGFDEFNKDGHKEELNASQITDLALTSIIAAKHEKRPFFCFLHYIDPHAPYDFHSAHNFDDDRTAIGAYDSEIAFADHHVGRLLDALKQEGLADNTIIALFADHGESFGEHNAWRHGTSLFEQQAHVPFLIHVPGLPPKTVSQRTSLMDLGPTTISLIGKKDPFQRIGRDLAPLMVPSPAEWQNYSYAERPNSPEDPYRSRERAIWLDDLKMVWDPPNGTYQVFDLARDPQENHNIFDPADPRQGALVSLMTQLDARIDSHWGQSPATTTTDATANETDDFKDSFAEAVAALEACSTANELVEAVDNMADHMKNPELSFSSERHERVGQGLVDRLRKRSEVLVVAAMQDPGMRDMLARFLVFTNGNSSLEILKEVKSQTRNSFIIQMVNFYLANQGDASCRAELEGLFQTGEPYSRFLTAQFLTKVGSNAGRELLRGALWSDGTFDGIRAAIALAALDDTETMLDFLLSPSKVWDDASVQQALLESAQRRDDSIGRSAILYLSNAGEEDVAVAARELLKAAFPSCSVDDLSKTYAAVFQACESIRYASWENAVAAFRGMTEAEAERVAPYWITLTRAAVICNDSGATSEFLGHLKTCGQTNRWLKSIADRYSSTTDRVALVLPENSGLVAANASVELGQKIAAGQPAIITVDITNDTDSFIIGGGSRNSLFLSVGWRNGKGEFLPWRQIRPLPFAGLNPGETQRLCLWTRIPKEKDAIQAEIVVIRGLPERAPKSLVAHPPLEREDR